MHRNHVVARTHDSYERLHHVGWLGRRLRRGHFRATENVRYVSSHSLEPALRSSARGYARRTQAQALGAVLIARRITKVLSRCDRCATTPGWLSTPLPPRTAMQRAARMRWLPSPRAGGGDD